VKGVTYSATLGTPILRQGLFEAVPSSSYQLTLRKDGVVFGTGIWDGDVILSGAHLDGDPTVEQRVFSALQRALAAREAYA
jgi:hypothetical protein